MASPRKTLPTAPASIAGIHAAEIRAVQVSVEPVALSLPDAARICGVPIWTIKENILVGNLQARWAGRSRIVLLTDLRQWAASLDLVTPSVAPSILQRKAARVTA